MTWKEWKDALERQGVRDDDEIEYIDCCDDDPEATITEKDGVRFVEVD